MGIRHPLRREAIATLVGLVILVAIPDGLLWDGHALRMFIFLLWMLQAIWLLCAVCMRKPPLWKTQRRQLMAWYIDRGLELARDEEERAMLLAWVTNELED